MAMATKNIIKDYKEQINKTLDELKEKVDYMLDDIEDSQVRKIEVIINIEGGCLVTYEINKEYIAQGDE
jgi:hypothetical protein